PNGDLASIEAALRESARRLQTSMRTELANARPLGLNRRLRRKLFAGQMGHHYLLSVDNNGMLVDERFAWWDAVRPGEGCDPLRDICSTDANRSCEFLPTLTTIVGSQLALVAGMGNVAPGMSPMNWESIGEGIPNRLMNAPFVFRESDWQWPILVTENVGF